MSDRPTILASTRIAQALGQISTNLNDETVIMSVEEGAYFNLNPIASDIWSRIAQPVTFSALLTTLTDHYDAPSETIEADARELLTDLFQNNLITLEN